MLWWYSPPTHPSLSPYITGAGQLSTHQEVCFSAMLRHRALAVCMSLSACLWVLLVRPSVSNCHVAPSCSDGSDACCLTSPTGDVGHMQPKHGLRTSWMGDLVRLYGWDQCGGVYQWGCVDGLCEVRVGEGVWRRGFGSNRCRKVFHAHTPSVVTYSSSVPFAPGAALMHALSAHCARCISLLHSLSRSFFLSSLVLGATCALFLS